MDKSSFGAFIPNVKPSGDSSGTTDYLNISQGVANNPALLVMPGQYYINNTINLSTPLFGLPAGVAKTGPAMLTRIKLVNNVSKDMFNITSKHVYLGNLEIDGNKVGQTGGAGNGITLGPGSDWVVIERCFIHDQYGRGISAGYSGGHKILDTSIQANNKAGVFLSGNCSDQTVRGCMIGSNGSDNLYTAGAVTHILDCDIWSSVGNGIKVDYGAQGTMISNCGIDRNTMSGIVILTSRVSVSNCTLHSNSQGGNSTYASIVVDNTNAATSEVAITGCNFWLDAGYTNLPSYHILYKNTASAKAYGNGFADGSYFTGTISGPSLLSDPNETALCLSSA